jgi:hypothetical protein
VVGFPALVAEPGSSGQVGVVVSAGPLALRQASPLAGRQLARHRPAQGADARHFPAGLQPLPMERGHIAEVVGKIRDILVAQLEVRSWLADRPILICCARQPTPHAAARHPEPARHRVHLGSREQPMPAQVDKPSHGALADRGRHMRLSAAWVGAAFHVSFTFRGQRWPEGHGTSSVYPSTGLRRGNLY